MPDLLFRPASPPADLTRPSDVAVVMRTRDRPILLRRALASVAGQTFDRWHLHLVNDGGDRAATEAVLDEARPRLGDRVSVRHNPCSLGMEAASNQALADARAACFAVHDDDDTWEPDFLAATTAFLDDRENASLIGVATGCTHVQERLEQDRIVIERRWPHQGIPDFLDLAQLLVLNRALPIGLVYRMSLLARIGPFNADLPVIGDWEFNLRASLIGEVGLIPTPLANYHSRPAATATSYANSLIAGRLRHRHYDRLLRNGVIRRTLADHPELLGVLQPVLHAVAAARDQLAAQVNAVGKALLDQQGQASERLLKEMLNLQLQQEEAIVARITAELRHAPDASAAQMN